MAFLAASLHCLENFKSFVVIIPKSFSSWTVSSFHIFHRWAYTCGVTCSLNFLGTGVNIPGDEGSGLVGLLSCHIGMEISG